MRSAETVLGIVRERGSRGLPLEDVYRQMYNPQLYLMAYGRIYRNKGAMTPSVTAETVDGMSVVKIDRIIEQLRYERFRWHPTRRVYIEKKNSTKKRPLGMPTWTDKLVQEVIRLILDAYYEPQFSIHSHGFRPQRGCHTALREIRHNWTGTTWFVEGDISQCFDKLDHEVLMRTLGERIHDNRFLRLINGALNAGYLEEWRFNQTLSGTPQGGVVSPILANIYLDRLDRYIEEDILPKYNRGDKRKRNPQWQSIANRVNYLRRTGRPKEAQSVKSMIYKVPAMADDPDYRRLSYVRYADDFLLGFTGPHEEAEEIKRLIGEYLREQLKLVLSEEKTLVTHARTGAAKFLGYEVVVHHGNDYITGRQRGANGKVGLRVPRKVIRQKCKAYMQHGKPVQRAERLQDDAYSIVARYQSEYRGVVNYYLMGYNVSQLGQLRWVMETSLTKTLANKFKISVRQVYKRYQTRIVTTRGTKRVLQVVVEREGKNPLVATWGAVTVNHRGDAILEDTPEQVWNGLRTEVVQRLLADTCELCGSSDSVAIHHIRALKSLHKPGRKAKPEWMQVMAARHRKTLAVCQTCHDEIHRPERVERMKRRARSARNVVTGEPDDAKVSSPVRRGVEGKVP